MLLARRTTAQSILERTPPLADARVPYGDDPNQFADLRLPEENGPHPCVIGIHGGFWRNRYGLDHFGHACAALTGEGFATWNLEYRRVGDPGGGWPGTFHDVVAASRHLFDHAGELGIDPDRVIVLGHSAGGHLASWLGSVANVSVSSPARATPLPIRGVVSLAGVLDLDLAWRLHLSNDAVAELLGGPPSAVPHRYRDASPRALVPSPVPHLLVHGTDDDVVPIAVSESHHRAAMAAGQRTTLLRLPGIGHFDVIDPESALWPRIVHAIGALIGAP